MAQDFFKARLEKLEKSVLAKETLAQR